MEHRSNDHGCCPNQCKNNHKLYNHKAFFFYFDGQSVKIETATSSEFPNEGEVILEQILASEERNKSKRAGLWERHIEGSK